MKTQLLLLVLLGGCSAAERPFNPVSDVEYSALGQDPFWMVSIGDDRIVLSLAAEGTDRLRSHPYPRTLPRVLGEVTRWESGEGTDVIAIEARAAPCPGSRGIIYRDQVTVSLSGRQLSGCGGPILRRGR